MQALLGRNGETALLGDGDEVAKVAKLHSIPPGYGRELTKSFSKAPVSHK
jgi:hypothetical protein